MTSGVGQHRVFVHGDQHAPLVTGRSYLMKLGTVTATTTIEQPLCRVDLDNNRSAVAGSLAANDIGTAVSKLDRLIAADRYLDRRDTGNFILIDPETGDTIDQDRVDLLIKQCGLRDAPQVCGGRTCDAEALSAISPGPHHFPNSVSQVPLSKLAKATKRRT